MSGKYMRKCTKCGVKHSPPTGAKCSTVNLEEDDSMPSLEDGDSVNEMLNWAGCGGPSKLDTDYQARDSNLYTFSPNKGQYNSYWPCLSSNPVKSEENSATVSGDLHRDRVGNKVTFEPDITKSELKYVKEEVSHVKRDLNRVAAETRSLLNKLEDLQRQSLMRTAPQPLQQRPTVSGPSHQDIPPRHTGTMPDSQKKADLLPGYMWNKDTGGLGPMVPGQQTKRDIDKRTSIGGDNRDYIPPSGSSVYESSSSSSCHSPKRDKSHQTKSRDKRKTYKIDRFLPRDERAKPMNTDKLWYCHGSLMLERYRLGKDISGMLEHNCFIAEKVSTKAYLPSGIIKYDEAV